MAMFIKDIIDNSVVNHAHSGTETPNVGIISLYRHGYANLFNTMHKPVIPSQTDPCWHLKTLGICRTLYKEGMSFFPKRNSALTSAASFSSKLNFGKQPQESLDF